MLRALALYHGKSPVHLFMVRLAQGLCHAGKGTVTLCPTHADRRLLNQPAIAGLLVVLTAFLDCKNSKSPARGTLQISFQNSHGENIRRYFLFHEMEKYYILFLLRKYDHIIANSSAVS